MNRMELRMSDKIVFGVAALVIGVFSGFGFYLIEGEPIIKSLAIAGHNHVLSFAYGGILFGLLLRVLNLSEIKKAVLAVWMSLTYLGPIALIYAGLSGNTALLAFTGPIFEGSFVILWLIAVALLFSASRARGLDDEMI